MSEKKTATLEENFAKIEEILADLERNDISIEDAFNKYSDGVELLKQCDESIDRVEKKVLKLMESGKTEEFADMEKDKHLNE
ncbi:MAG: exodeoxyribonuclease VII small subunit [Lachnospiraceae bacterium]|nr:exodeoxyribonuclease VII small subunit [Lachnospiraceae bacterium]